MKNKKFEITVIIILILFSIIIYGGYLIYAKIRSRDEYVLFTKPFNILNCYKYDCEIEKDYKKYNNKNYLTFINGENKGNNKIFYNTNNKNYYVFNNQNKNIFDNDLDADDTKFYLIGYDGKIVFNSKIVKKEIMNDEDFQILSNITNTKIANENMVPTYKYVMDFDNDLDNEILYYYNYFYNNNYYNLLAYKDNDKAKTILFNKYTDANSFVNIDLEDVIDIYDDKKLEFLLVKSLNGKYCTDLYHLKHNKFVVEKECKIAN